MVENDIYNKLHSIPNCHFMRIETMTENGIPDVNGCIKYSRQSNFGLEVWLELKIGVPRLRASQVSWFTRAYAKGRRAFVLTHYEGNYQLYQPKRFGPIGLKHFTPLDAPLIRCKSIESIIPFLTSD